MSKPKHTTVAFKHNNKDYSFEVLNQKADIWFTKKENGHRFWVHYDTEETNLISVFEYEPETYEVIHSQPTNF